MDMLFDLVDQVVFSRFGMVHQNLSVYTWKFGESVAMPFAFPSIERKPEAASTTSWFL